MDYQEDQILDNLIRASKHRPIVHYDVKQVDAKVTTALKASAAGGRTVTREIARKIERPLAFLVEPARADELLVSMVPVLANNEVYTAYEAFVALEGSVRTGTPDEPEIIGTKWKDGQYYWIPQSFAEEFFQLCLRTSVKRGELKGKEGSPAASSGAPSSSNGKPSTHGSSKRIRIPKALLSPSTSPEVPLSNEAKAFRDAAQDIRQSRLRD